MAFTHQTTRRLLGLVALVQLVASVFVLWRAFCEPNLRKVSEVDDRAARPRSVADASFTRELDEFDPLFQRSLGAPLYDSPTPKQAPPPRQEPKPKLRPTLPPKQPRPTDAGLRVIGTVIESGKSLAIFADTNGSIQLRGEGDSIETSTGSAKIDRIELRQVSISFEDETLTLKAP